MRIHQTFMAYSVALPYMSERIIILFFSKKGAFGMVWLALLNPIYTAWLHMLLDAVLLHFCHSFPY